jgi:AsmA protein
MRRILTTLMILLAVVVAGLTALVLLVNPNDFRAYMVHKVAERSGYQLELDGPLRWHVWPQLSILSGRMTLTAPGRKNRWSRGQYAPRRRAAAADFPSAAGQAGDAQGRGDPADPENRSRSRQDAPVVPHDNTLPLVPEDAAGPTMCGSCRWPTACSFSSMKMASR